MRTAQQLDSVWTMPNVQTAWVEFVSVFPTSTPKMVIVWSGSRYQNRARTRASVWLTQCALLRRKCANAARDSTPTTAGAPEVSSV